ncbi:ribosome silencing factor [Lusitaniella coriacea LEGE 07157]|uniref:Ribosomal silencing factor RsfS n=1 Tax=Lusitaniella coriacea LEGE 07157 TaxID=945747 RepID=A0A8J7IVS3_9CYAN|nr:ribosome silencing factor [Lusitaniella coriacea]MBE9117493.1 ribosome silencing factor [Lusitaniella coriacea LEGE 07157]
MRENDRFNASSTISGANNNEEDSSLQLAHAIAEAADDRKASDIVILGVTELCYLTDYFVIVSGFSKTQVRAIADSIEDKTQKELQRVPLRTEGKTEGTWILQDYGDVIVHTLLPTEREYYNLEAFWGHAERIPFKLSQSIGE